MAKDNLSLSDGATTKGGGLTSRPVTEEERFPLSLPPPARRTAKVRDSSRQIRHHELPADEITTKPIRPDQAKALATTRRARVSEFAIGALIAVAPGAIQTITDWASDSARNWPSPGHLVEIVFAIMAFTAVARSLLDFDSQTSRDVLEEIFPGEGKHTSVAWCLGKLYRRFADDFHDR